MPANDIFTAVILTSLLVLLLVGGIILSFFISGRQRIKQQVELAEARLAFEREIRQVEAEVSEHVMGQFGQELHDNIGQLLTAAHIQVENQKIDHPALAEGLKPIEIYLAEISQQLRLLSRTLNQDYLGNIGLFSALQTEVERLQALRRFHLHWQVPQGVSGLDKNQELMVFRIFQEITQNALRHSGAEHVYIIITTGSGFELSVKDDGRGFDKNAMFLNGKASGLRNILRRANLAGLSCTISSEPGKGSLFVLKKFSTLV